MGRKPKLKLSAATRAMLPGLIPQPITRHQVMQVLINYKACAYKRNLFVEKVQKIGFLRAYIHYRRCALRPNRPAVANKKKGFKWCPDDLVAVCRRASEDMGITPPADMTIYAQLATHFTPGVVEQLLRQVIYIHNLD